MKFVSRIEILKFDLLSLLALLEESSIILYTISRELIRIIVAGEKSSGRFRISSELHRVIFVSCVSFVFGTKYKSTKETNTVLCSSNIWNNNGKKFWERQILAYNIHKPHTTKCVSWRDKISIYQLLHWQIILQLRTDCHRVGELLFTMIIYYSHVKSYCTFDWNTCFLSNIFLLCS